MRSSVCRWLHPGRLARAVAVLSAFQIVGSCSDSPAVAPHRAFEPGHASFSVAPIFPAIPPGAPVPVLSRIRGLLIGVRGDTIVAEAKFVGDSAVLVFDVRFSGNTAAYRLELTAFDLQGVEAYHATKEYSLKEGENRDLSTPVLIYSAPDAALQTLHVGPGALQLNAGGTAALSVSGTGASGQAITVLRVGWTSRDGSVATVDDAGVVHAGAFQGSTWIVARTVLDVSDSVLVKVKAPVDKVIIAPGAVELLRGLSGAVNAELRDAGGHLIDDRAATWTSSDPSVATVSAAGVVQALKVGATSVSATAEGKTSAVTVSVVTPLDHVELSPGSLSMASLKESGSLAARLVAKPGGSVADIPVTYSSSNGAVASVNAKGVVTATGNGLAIITADAEGKTATAAVNVKQVAVSVSVTPKTAGVTSLGESATFTGTALDALGSPIAGAPLNWSSSDASVAQVGGGTAVGKHAGSVSITASMDGKSDNATFIVAPVPKMIVVLADKGQIETGQVAHVVAQLGDAAGNAIGGVSATLTTDTPGIASLSGGVVTGLTPGIAHITASVGALTGGVSIRVVAAPGAGLVVTPASVEKLPGGTQQFAVADPNASVTWTVNGVTGGNSTFGTITAGGLYTAPASVPSPAIFDVCAVQANPVGRGCSQVTITAIPSSGADVIVFNDIDTFDGGATDANNQTMFRNLVNYPGSGTRISKTGIMFYKGHASRLPYALTSMRSTIAAAGFTVTDVTAELSSPIDPSYKVIFLYLPTTAFTMAEINNLKSFSGEGGRIVFVGEWDGFYGAAGIATENAFFKNMGAQMTNSGGAYDCGYVVEPASRLRPHQVTAGLTQLTIACASEVLPGPNDYPFLYSTDGLHVLAAAAKVDITPLRSSSLRSPQRTIAPPSKHKSDLTPVARDPNDTKGRPIGHAP
jgi:hypothetical protein